MDIRETIDLLKQNDHFVLSNATVWVPGYIFLLHRLLGIGLFLANAYLLWSLKKDNTLIEISRIQKWILLLFLLQIISGFLNVFYDIPAMINVVHIAASAAIVGLQFRILVSKTN
jgi:heme A synthase